VKFGPQLVKLFGIDAPEKGQTCDDGHWHPGLLAKKALEVFTAGRPVTCKQVGYDARNNRPVAQCYAGDDDLQALMVSAGWAWSFGQYSQRYAPEEREAVTAKLGVHGHRCIRRGSGGRSSVRETASSSQQTLLRCWSSQPLLTANATAAFCQVIEAARKHHQRGSPSMARYNARTRRRAILSLWFAMTPPARKM
jgi:hypothetical protein